MAEHGLATLGVLAVISLLIGALLGYALTPVDVRTVEVPKQCPAEKACPVAEAQEVVIKEVPVNYLAKAQAEFLKEVEDNEDLQVCEEQTYDFDQIKVSKAYEDHSVIFGEDTEEITASWKLKYLDKDTGEKCYNTFDAKVTFEEGEDPIVEIL